MNANWLNPPNQQGNILSSADFVQNQPVYFQGGLLPSIYGGIPNPPLCQGILLISSTDCISQCQKFHMLYRYSKYFTSTKKVGTIAMKVKNLTSNSFLLSFKLKFINDPTVSLYFVFGFFFLISVFLACIYREINSTIQLLQCK